MVQHSFSNISHAAHNTGYFDRYLLNHLTHSARCMVDFVTRDEESATRIREGVALIPNVTSGMNAVVGGHARTSSRNGHGHGLVFYYVSLYSYIMYA